VAKALDDWSLAPEYPAVRVAWLHGKPWPNAAAQSVSSVGTIREFAAHTALRNNVSSVWAEFGVENGISAQYFLSQLPEDGRLLLYDSFEGLPEPWQGKPAGSHKAIIKPEFNDDRVIMHEGWFKDTLPCDEVLGFVHIDCDLYSSTRTVLQGIKVVPGTVVLFDELFGFPDWREQEYKALQEWGIGFRYIARDTKYRAVVEIL